MRHWRGLQRVNTGNKNKGNFGRREHQNHWQWGSSLKGVKLWQINVKFTRTWLRCTRTLDRNVCVSSFKNCVGLTMVGGHMYAKVHLWIANIVKVIFSFFLYTGSWPPTLLPSLLSKCLYLSGSLIFITENYFNLYTLLKLLLTT